MTRCQQIKINFNNVKDYGLIVDNFAGGGGASTGIELALGRPVDIAINHDPQAIALHKVNHPKTKHYCENVWDINPKEVCNGRKVALAWFSPDCTHFSKAKGSKPVDKNIRGLAWVVLRWAAAVRPKVIILENVEEFKTWGPIRKGKPIKSKKGETFEKWKNQLLSLGYNLDHRELVASDYGAPTKRKRFFLIARCDGSEIVWPEATHADRNSEEVKYGLLKPYVPAADIIDWSIPCPSIFERKRPLAEKTLARIARGIQKFVIEENEPFIIPIGYSENVKQAPRVNSIRDPLGTIVSTSKHYLVSAFISKYFGGGYSGAGSDVRDSLPTVTAVDHNALCTAHIIQMNKNMVGSSMKEPINTIVAGTGHIGEVRVFLIKYYCGDKQYQSLKEPLGTIVSKDRFGLVTIQGEKYQIVDIGLRMLSPRELYRAQGFPDDYIIDKDDKGKAYPVTQQVARCGNSVPPAFAEALVRVNLPEQCVEGKINLMSKFNDYVENQYMGMFS